MGVLEQNKLSYTDFGANNFHNYCDLLVENTKSDTSEEVKNIVEKVINNYEKIYS